jgi:argininosuccinate synthase
MTVSAFTPEDRIGALELQNLAVADNRSLLLHYLNLPSRLQPGSALGELLSPGKSKGED